MAEVATRPEGASTEPHIDACFLAELRVPEGPPGRRVEAQFVAGAAAPLRQNADEILGAFAGRPAGGGGLGDARRRAVPSAQRVSLVRLLLLLLVREEGARMFSGVPA